MKRRCKYIPICRVGTPEAKPDDQHTICMTCDDPCEYTHISLSPDKMYYINTCWGPGVPTYTLKSLQENKSGMFGIKKTKTKFIV